jgi:hypothetical protein
MYDGRCDERLKITCSFFPSLRFPSTTLSPTDHHNSFFFKKEILKKIACRLCHIYLLHNFNDLQQGRKRKPWLRQGLGLLERESAAPG